MSVNKLGLIDIYHPPACGGVLETNTNEINTQAHDKDNMEVT